MLEIFDYDFMVRAFIVGIFTAISTAILGNFVVTARQAVMSDMLAHTALVGVGLGIFWQVSPTLLALAATVVSALLLWWMSRKNNQAPEALSMLLLTGGLATALLLTHLNKNNPVSLDTYLFGSILTITEAEMYSFIALNLLVVVVLVSCWRPLLTLVFDKEFMQTQRFKVFYEILFMILMALIVGIGLKVIGGLLIGALLVIPVLIAQHFTQSFKHSVGVSIIANLLAIITGIVCSFYLDIPASSGIVLSLIFLYGVSKTLTSFHHGHR
jgi:zinc transport system permease protein